MTDKHDDVEKLARELSGDIAGCLAHWNGGLVGVTSKKFFESCNEAFVEKLRAHFAQRDEQARKDLKKAAELAKQFLIYAKNGHYGPDNSGLELVKQIAALAAEEQAKVRDLSHEELKSMAVPPPQEWLEEEWPEEPNTEPAQ